MLKKMAGMLSYLKNKLDIGATKFAL